MIRPDILAHELTNAATKDIVANHTFSRTLLLSCITELSKTFDSLHNPEQHILNVLHSNFEVGYVEMLRKHNQLRRGTREGIVTNEDNFYIHKKVQKIISEIFADKLVQCDQTSYKIILSELRKAGITAYLVGVDLCDEIQQINGKIPIFIQGDIAENICTKYLQIGVVEYLGFECIEQFIYACIQKGSEISVSHS